MILFIDSDAGGGGGGGSTTTWSPTDKTAGWALTNGDLTATENTSSSENIRGSAGVAPGDLIYFEVHVTTTGSSAVSIGLRDSTDSISTALSGGKTGNWRSNGSTFASGGFSDSLSVGSYTSADVLGFAVNRVTHAMYVHKNGTYQNSGNPVAGTGGKFTLPVTGILMPYVWTNNDATNNSVVLAADPSDWSYSAPSGYSALP